MPEIKKYSMQEELKIADDKYMHSPALVGKSGLTFPMYTNSTRTQMFTSHLSQFLNILKAQFPYLFTGVEKVVGEYSSGYQETKNDSVVFRKVAKFADIVDEVFVYHVFLWDKKKKRYYVVDREPAEGRMEDSGFLYDNTVVDALEEGEEVKAGTWLFHSKSYDDYGNYGYGRNVPVIFVLDPYTSEDSAEISDEFSEDMACIKYIDRTIGLNQNEILLNMHGKDGKYRGLPKIGEMIKSHIAVTRPLHNERLLFDLKEDNLGIIKDGDRVFYSGGKNAQLVDYTIYCNVEELPDNIFYKQIKKLYKSQNKYWKEIYNTCKEIMESGCDYTDDIDYLYKRAEEFLDTVKKWRNGKDSCPGGVEIHCKLIRKKNLGVGDKFTGRYGNKSVVSKVTPVKEMPFTETGLRVHVKLNLLAISNRTTGYVPHELYITFITNRLRELLFEMKSLEEQEKLLFEVIRDLNEEQYQKMYVNDYALLDKKGKEEYMYDCIHDGIYIHQDPVWEDRSIFYKLMDMTEKYEWLRPYRMFQEKWGQTFETLTPMYVGFMYMFRLKQTGERGFSARSMGAINPKGLPERSYKNRTGTDIVSDTPIRLGEFEYITLNTGMTPEEIMAVHACYRTSVKGRRDITKSLFSKDGIASIDDSYTSRVAELFSVIFKSLGYATEFIDPDDCVYAIDDTSKCFRTYNGCTYFLTDYEFEVMKKRQEISDAISQKYPLIDADVLEKVIDQKLAEKKSGIFTSYRQAEV